MRRLRGWQFPSVDEWLTDKEPPATWCGSSCSPLWSLGLLIGTGLRTTRPIMGRPIKGPIGLFFGNFQGPTEVENPVSQAVPFSHAILPSGDTRIMCDENINVSTRMLDID